MKQLIFIISVFFSLNLFGQKQEIENLINQIAAEEVPGNFKYYFLVSESLAPPKEHDSLQNYEIRELKMKDKDFSESILYKEQKDTINWRNYDLNNVHYVSDGHNRPSKVKKVKFVKYNIDPKEYDSLINNKAPYTLILKKKWFWNKRKIWDIKEFRNILYTAWNEDDINHPEETVYFQFSNPVFSEDKKFAVISVAKEKACTGNGFTALYINENGIWRKLHEFNGYKTVSYSTHFSCDAIGIDYE
ncbi:hypothetical protein NAT51_08115 [Flavobacterium amniphilum]|uniref:hypothetical protein n=1 Tax=Flavobacterium amniphilum TaxID=1834035 RepID=UPI00202AA41E|nr:hypothetical protein [Flavobacterium amniphilum]MCL9805483.1 hypothetical protein [Flavobacterium amniphilum]